MDIVWLFATKIAFIAIYREKTPESAYNKEFTITRVF